MDDNFLSRWSRRKIDARAGRIAEREPESTPRPAVPETARPSAVEAPAAQPLPPVESLTPESDFTPFMKPEVEEGVKRQALRTLFRDPQFNVQDGLDIYIADYSQPDPIPPEWIDQLNQMARAGDYPERVAQAERAAQAEREARAQGVPASENSESQQALAQPAASGASVTPDAGVPPPAVPE